jgi:hypothetical protein
LIDAFQQFAVDSNILAGQLLLDSKGLSEPIHYSIVCSKEFKE